MATGVYIHKKGYKRPKEFGQRLSTLFKGRQVSKETRLKMSIAKLGKQGLKHSEETKRKIGISNSRTQKGKPKPWKKGDKNHFWKGGITPINEAIRKSLEYKLWRRAVFERDDYTCVWCKIKGGNLHVDHIKPFAYFPELRFAIDNGRTLCKSCHLSTETYGNRLKTKTKKSWN